MRLYLYNKNQVLTTDNWKTQSTMAGQWVKNINKDEFWSFTSNIRGLFEYLEDFVSYYADRAF